MGRYITGDIERKLWFGVQSSTAADRFGVQSSEPAYLEYYFDKEDNLKELFNELNNSLVWLISFMQKPSSNIFLSNIVVSIVLSFMSE